MVPFAGYSMPVQYDDLGVGESHKWVREKAGLFDVGHMYVTSSNLVLKSRMNGGEHCRAYVDPSYCRVQHHMSGPGATSFLEMVTPTNITDLQPNHSTLSCLLHPFTGGIVDDTVITRLGQHLFYLVTNAACKKKDIAYLEEQLQMHDTSLGGVNWEVRDGWGLVALQGPLSAEILAATLQRLGNEDVKLQELYFGQCVSAQVQVAESSQSFSVLVSRGGYTGEDGFEISIPPDQTEPFTKLLLEIGTSDRLRLAGLGARDSLRLEAGMCLYGHDLDDNITPVEAGLSWIIPKDRRISGGFNGHETILTQLKSKNEGGGVEKRRVGLIVEGAPAREGAEIISGEDEEVIGRITSGCPSPTLGKNIAMGYIKSGMHKAGTEVGVRVRGKKRKGQVVKMPFVASKYWKQAAGTAPA